MREFEYIYRENIWGSTETVSGPGSTLHLTSVIREKLPGLFKELSISSLLDLPCGDFNWMSTIDLSGVEYIGGDVVEELIGENRKNYPFYRFEVMNIVWGNLPTVDLVLCRDCLVHLPNIEVIAALRNIKKSGSRYLLTTHFTEKKKRTNVNLKRRGGWRPLHLELAPFELPKPIITLNEGVLKGEYNDKSLSLWDMHEIEHIGKRQQEQSLELLW